MRHIIGADTCCRVTPQRNNMTNTRRAISTDDIINTFPGCTDTGQMRGRTQRGLAHKARHGPFRPLPCRATSSISDRDKIRIERRKPFNRIPEHRLGVSVLCRKKFERDPESARSPASANLLGDGVHHATSRPVSMVARDTDCRLSRARKSETVNSLSDASGGAIST